MCAFRRSLPPVLLALLVSSSAWCLPATVHLTGSPDLIEAAARSLTAQDLTVSREPPRPDDAGLRVDIQRAGESLIVTVDDAQGQHDSRAVASLDSAAAWIDSWARRDLIAPLLPMGTALVPTRQPLEFASPQSVNRTSEVPALAPRAFTHHAVRLGVTSASDRLGDHTWGATVGVAQRQGRVDWGASAGVAFGTAQANLPATMRNGHLGLSASWPISMGAFDVRPGVVASAQLTQRHALQETSTETCIDAATCKKLQYYENKAQQTGAAGDAKKAEQFRKTAMITTQGVRDADTTWLAPFVGASLSVARHLSANLAVTADVVAGGSPWMLQVGGDTRAPGRPDPWQVGAQLGMEWRWD